jgi:hypothetical protein
MINDAIQPVSAAFFPLGTVGFKLMMQARAQRGIWKEFS